MISIANNGNEIKKFTFCLLTKGFKAILNNDNVFCFFRINVVVKTAFLC